MAYSKGVRIWRFRGGRWEYVSRKHPQFNTSLEPAWVRLPAGYQPQPDDWLFEEVNPAGRTSLAAAAMASATIPAHNIMFLIRDSSIPKDSDIYYYDGEKVSMIYKRSGSPRSAQELTIRQWEVEAAVDSGGGSDRLIIIYRGDLKPIVYDRESRRFEQFDLEVTTGTMDFENAVTNVAGVRDGNAARVYDTLVLRLAHARRNVELALQSHDHGDQESAGKLAGQVLAEVLMGATPGAIQGHNALHSLPSIIDDFEKLHQVVSNRQDIDEIADSSRAGATGDFGAGVTSVDATWQAVGSIISSLNNIYQLGKLDGMSKEERRAADGKHARLRKTADLGTNLMKGAQTTWKAVDAIKTVSNAATTMPSPVAPITGSVFGFITAARSSVQAHKARKRKNTLQKELERAKGAGLDKDVQDILGFAARKTMRKFRTKTAEATTGSISGVGGVVVICLMAAGANAWNPVGWGLGIAVFVAGAGMLSYKIFKKATSNRRAKKRGFSTEQFPYILLRNYTKWALLNPDAPETQVLRAMLEAFGVSHADIDTGDARKSDLAVKQIARHLASR